MYIVIYIVVTLLSISTFIMEFFWTTQAKELSKDIDNLHAQFELLSEFKNCNDSLDFVKAITLSQTEKRIHFNDQLWFKQLGLCETILLLTLGFIMIKLVLIQPLPWTVVRTFRKKERSKSRASSRK